MQKSSLSKMHFFFSQISLKKFFPIFSELKKNLTSAKQRKNFFSSFSSKKLAKSLTFGCPNYKQETNSKFYSHQSLSQN